MVVNCPPQTVVAEWSEGMSRLEIDRRRQLRDKTYLYVANLWSCLCLVCLVTIPSRTTYHPEVQTKYVVDKFGLLLLGFGLSGVMFFPVSLGFVWTMLKQACQKKKAKLPASEQVHSSFDGIWTSAGDIFEIKGNVLTVHKGQGYEDFEVKFDSPTKISITDGPVVRTLELLPNGTLQGDDGHKFHKDKQSANDEGVPTKYHSMDLKYHCGRCLPGSNSACNGESGLQCASCERYQNKLSLESWIHFKAPVDDGVGYESVEAVFTEDFDKPGESWKKELTSYMIAVGPVLVNLAGYIEAVCTLPKRDPKQTLDFPVHCIPAFELAWFMSEMVHFIIHAITYLRAPTNEIDLMIELNKISEQLKRMATVSSMCALGYMTDLKAIGIHGTKMITSKVRCKYWLAPLLIVFVIFGFMFSIGIAGLFVKVKMLSFVNDKPITEWRAEWLKAFLFINNIVQLPQSSGEYSLSAVMMKWRDLQNFCQGPTINADVRRRQQMDTLGRNLVRFQGKIGAHVLWHTIDEERVQRIVNESHRLPPIVGKNTIGHGMRPGTGSGEGTYYCGGFVTVRERCGPRAGPQCKYCKEAQAKMPLLSAGHTTQNVTKRPLSSAAAPAYKTALPDIASRLEAAESQLLGLEPRVEVVERHFAGSVPPGGKKMY